MTDVKKKAGLVPTPVVIRLPKNVIAALDKAAKTNCRSRSSEMRSRLLQSLSSKGQA